MKIKENHERIFINRENELKNLFAKYSHIVESKWCITNDDYIKLINDILKLYE